MKCDMVQGRCGGPRYGLKNDPGCSNIDKTHIGGYALLACVNEFVTKPRLEPMTAPSWDNNSPESALQTLPVYKKLPSLLSHAPIPCHTTALCSFRSVCIPLQAAYFGAISHTSET